jgi:hypothetical protein
MSKLSIAAVPFIWALQHWKLILATTGGIALTGSIIRLQLRLYIAENRYEYVPTTDSRPLFWQFLMNSLKIWVAIKRYNIMTLWGRFLPNVRYYSATIEETIIRHPDIRPLFIPAGDKIEAVRCHSIHSHPTSAMCRSSASDYLIQSCRRAGYTPYVISASKRDNCDGNRFFYSVKDFGIPYRNDPIKPGSALIFVDVDYYADMRRWMNLFMPISMYTLVPETITHNGTESSYRFNGNQLVYNVSGGGEYKHFLWDYKGDVVTTIDNDCNLLVFEIEQRKIEGDETHRFVWLVPKAKVTNPLWFMCYNDWLDRILYRKVVSDGTLLSLWDPITDIVSIGLVGSNYSVTLNGKLYEAIRIRLLNKETTVYVSDVERMLKEQKHAGYVQDAPILFKCLSGEHKIHPNVVSTGYFPTTFAAIPKTGGLSTEDPRTAGRATSTPLVSSPALFTTKGYNADRACYEGRIEAVRNRTNMSVAYKRYANEFVLRMIPDHLAGTGVPLSMEAVRDKQDKSTQRGRFDTTAPTMSTESLNKIKCFIKTEPYAAAKKPRNISTMSTEITIQSSAYSLAIAPILKQQKWFCPGKTPKQIINRLAEVMLQDTYNVLEEGDFTCLDGTQNEDLSNNLTLAIYERYFAPEYRAEFRRIYKQIYTKNASSADGVRMALDWIIRSGCSFTTHAGSFINAFATYCAFRKLGMGESEAWEAIGAIFGDDSLNANHRGLFSTTLQDVTSELGLIYKSVQRQRGQPVLFLGRYFIDPTSVPDSFADPMRTICKLHLSSNPNVSVEQAATNKAFGYISTDKLTPIIGTWAQKVIDITGLKFKQGTGEEQYKCSNSWPQRDVLLIRENMALVLDIDTSELDRREAQIKSVTGLDQFPVLFDTTYGHAQTAVVDGNLVGTDLHQTTNGEIKREPTPSGHRFQQARGPDEGGNVYTQCQPTFGSRKRPSAVTPRRTRREANSPRVPRRHNHHLLGPRNYTHRDARADRAN